MPNSIIPHPPNELETKETAELGERTAHPFPRPESPAKQPPGERPRPYRPAGPVQHSGASRATGAAVAAGVNQGEGDRASARQYEDHLRSFVATGKVEPAARDAARAVDGPEAAELRAAEERGKAPAKPSLIARANGVVETVRGIIHDLRERRRQRH